MKKLFKVCLHGVVGKVVFISIFMSLFALSALATKKEAPTPLLNLNYSFVDDLVFLNIQDGAYLCGPPISDLVSILRVHPSNNDGIKNQLMQIAIDRHNCCSMGSDLWALYESDGVVINKNYEKQTKALLKACDLKKKRQALSFVNILKDTSFLSTCPALETYIHTMIEPYDSRLGVLLIIEEAKKQHCGNLTQLHKIRTEIEEARKDLLQERYNISYQNFEVDDI